MTPVNRELEELAEKIRKECQWLLESSRTSLSHARRCGELLNDAKAKVKHGEWEAWLKENCHLSVRTAQLYMRLANKGDELAAKAQSIADLTIAEAADLLSTPRSKVVEVVEAPTPSEIADDDLEPQPVEVTPTQTLSPVLAQTRTKSTKRDMPVARIEPQKGGTAADNSLETLAMIASRLELCRGDVSRGDWDKKQGDGYMSVLANITALVDAIRSMISGAVEGRVA